MALSFVEVNPPGKPQAVIIWLHGLGDSGHGFAPIVPELRIPDEMGVRFVFPHAPVRAVTINGGMQMNAWYDIKTMALEDRADEAGVIESAQLVKQLLDDEIARGTPSERIILAGFSQGGVIALHLAARLPYTLAGVMAMSTYMCKPQKLSADKQPANQHTPILMAHGTVDEVVPTIAGIHAKEALLENGYQVQWFDYPMGHTLCLEQIQEITRFIKEVLQNTNNPG